MKKILTIFGLNFCFATCYALGPNEINFNGITFYKSNEKQQNNAVIAEYTSVGDSQASIILTHVLNKNDPNKIAQDLKTKKSIDVVDIESLNTDNSDVLVSFVKFDASNSRVQNNICRIKRSGEKEGSFVFQYMDTKRLKSQAEGTTLPDFTQLSEVMKKAPIDKILNSTSSAAPNFAARGERSPSAAHMPWYKRTNMRSGRSAYERRSRTYHRYHHYPYR
ncbi:MAG: hypothetical protein JSS07_01895 [Proteobacteria bacterium]|nr:hypothetical protein [Pseudomonadota bacterium]